MGEDVRDLVLIRIDDPDFWSNQGDLLNDAERRIRAYLVDAGRSVDNNALAALSDVSRADAFVDGVETDFKTLFGGSQDALLRNIEDALPAPQGSAVVVDAASESSFTFTRDETRAAIQSVLDTAAVPVELSRIDVILSDETLLTWLDGRFVS